MSVNIIYHHSDHKELCEALRYALSRINDKLVINIKNEIINDDIMSKNLFIFVDLHHYLYLRRMPQKYIIYNYQQLPFGRLEKFKRIAHLVPNAIEIWDYSMVNIELIKKLFNFKVRHVPFGYSPNFTKKQDFSKNKDIDVLLIGFKSERREKLINDMKNQGINAMIGSNIYDDKKNELINRAKILLNIHKHGPEDILETARLCYYISNKGYVISEDSCDTVAVNKFSGNMIYGKYNELIDLCKKALILDQDQRNGFGENSYQWLINKYDYGILLRDSKIV